MDHRLHRWFRDNRDLRRHDHWANVMPAFELTPAVEWLEGDGLYETYPPGANYRRGLFSIKEDGDEWGEPMYVSFPREEEAA